MADRHLDMCHKEMWGGRCDCRPRKKRTPLRTAFALREVVRIKKTDESKDVYFSSMVGKGRSYAVNVFDGVQGLEDMVLSYLACKPGDRLEVFMSFRKVDKKKGARA